jgi:sterol desaturase/sphingolipid hydroxylase (fatty acid hydroxylase superfamily)
MDSFPAAYKFLPTTLALFFATVAVFALIEWTRPVYRMSVRGYAINIRIALFFILAAPAVALWPNALATSFVQWAHSHVEPIILNMLVFAFWFDEPLSPVGWRPSAGATLIFWLAGLLVIDFFFYWYHRLAHTPLFWRIHRIHHSDANISAATAYRAHVLEAALQVFAWTMPMALLFAFKPIETLILGYAAAMHTMFIHANIRCNLGPLTPIFTGPQYHRTHHSIEQEHRDRNFALYFPLWDIVFGTYYRPRRGEFPATGVRGEESEITWWEMVARPFHALPHQSPDDQRAVGKEVSGTPDLREIKSEPGEVCAEQCADVRHVRYCTGWCVGLRGRAHNERDSVH